jgi:hypothetical protein
VGFYPFRGPDAPLTRGPSYRRARECARVGARGLSFTSRGFTLIDADHSLGHESRICAGGRGSPARSRVEDLRGWSRITLLVTRRGFARMVADHPLGYEARILADGRGSPARLRGTDSRRWLRITGSVTSCGIRANPRPVKQKESATSLREFATRAKKAMIRGLSVPSPREAPASGRGERRDWPEPRRLPNRRRR